MAIYNPLIDNTVVVTLRRSGVLYPVAPTSTVRGRWYTPDGLTPFTSWVTSSSADPLGDWTNGEVAFTFDDAETRLMTGVSALLLVEAQEQGGAKPQWWVRFELALPGTDSALFPDRQSAVSGLQSQLVSMGYTISESDAWASIKAAVADAQHKLRVFLRPTVIVPDDAPLSEIQALEAAGTAYATEAAYDYDPHVYQGEAWGFVALRQKPLISIQSMQFAYPTPGQTIFEVPASWMRLDKQYAHLQLVPVGMTVLAPLSAMMLGTISGGRSMPMLVRIRYTAGLTDAHLAYPDLVDATKKLAAFKILQGQFLPQSGSISADGLSQSSSIDFDKWMHGPGGIDATFDKLYEAIHGPRLAVLG